jgi:hypothetical protein
MYSLAQKTIEINKGKIAKDYNAKIVRYPEIKSDFEHYFENEENNEFLKKTSDTEVIIMKKKKDIFINMESKTFGKRNSCEDLEIIKKLQEHACQRSKTKIKRLIVCNNLWNHCGTTYARAEEGYDREKVLYDNVKFLMRLAYQQNKKIDYVAVPEIQPERYLKYLERVYHMHVALNFDITEKEMYSAWNSYKCMDCKKYDEKVKNFQCKECKYFKGVVWVNREKDKDLRRIANYYAKYFSKGFEDEELNQRSFSQNRYLCSHGLKMPKIEEVNLTDKEILRINKASNYISSFSDGNSFNCIKEDVLSVILSLKDRDLRSI